MVQQFPVRFGSPPLFVSDAHLLTRTEQQFLPSATARTCPPMNLTILANSDLASCIALNHLVPQLEGHTISVLLSSQVGAKQTKAVPPSLAELKFFEQTLFTELLFPALDSVTGGHATGSDIASEPPPLHTFNGLKTGRWQTADQPEPLHGRIGNGTQTPSVRTVAILNQINTNEGLARLRVTRPDLILSIRYGVILREAAIAVPRLGVLNLHSGRLPDYRGVMASFWALLNGETVLGTTLHFIDDPGIDTGRVVSTTTLPVRADKSYLWHVLALYEDGCRNMAQAVAALASGEPLPASPQAKGGHYYTFPDESDLARFAAGGRYLFTRDEVVAVARRFL